MSKKKSKPTFWEFMIRIHGIDCEEYERELNAMQKQAAELDYINRYGAPIRWF